MNTKAIIERFILDNLIADPQRTSIGLDEPLVSSGLIDSLATLRLISFLEEDLGARVGDGDVVPENFETLRGIITFLDRTKAAPPSQQA